MAVVQPHAQVFATGDYTSIFNAAQQAVVSVEGQIEQAEWQGGTVLGRTAPRPHTHGVRLTATIWKLDDQNHWRLDLSLGPVNPMEALNPLGLHDLSLRFVGGMQRWHSQGFYLTQAVINFI